MARDDKGNAARQMAAAPLPQTPVTETPSTVIGAALHDAAVKSSETAARRISAEMKLNPFAEKFGTAVFAMPAKAGKYANEDGSSSRKLATVLIPIDGTGVSLKGTIYCSTRRVKRDDGLYEVDETYLSLPSVAKQSGFVCASPAATQHLESFKLSIVQAYAEWAKTLDASAMVTSGDTVSRLVTARKVVEPTPAQPTTA